MSTRIGGSTAIATTPHVKKVAPMYSPAFIVNEFETKPNGYYTRSMTKLIIELQWWTRPNANRKRLSYNSLHLKDQIDPAYPLIDLPAKVLSSRADSLTHLWDKRESKQFPDDIYLGYGGDSSVFFWADEKKLNQMGDSWPVDGLIP